MGFVRLGAGDAAQRNGVERLVSLIRRLDSTRPIIDNDGWEQTNCTDIVAIHDYSHTGAELAERYVRTLSHDELPEAIWLGNRATFLPGAFREGKPVMLTEVGGFLTRPEGVEKLDVMYDIYDSISSGKELENKYAELIEGISRLPFVAGFCYTQLTDVEQEMNGLLTYGRQPKVNLEAVAKINKRCGRP
jgi:hypothetical protein